MFVVTDMTSNRGLNPGDIFGGAQRVWIENQIVFASLHKDIKVLFIVSPLPPNGWILQRHDPSRRFLADLLSKHIDTKNTQVIFLAGDAHMIGFDDGRFNEIGPYPVVQAASLDSRPNCKGGPYSHGFFPGIGQFAVIDVEDEGERVCVKVSLKRMEETMIFYDTCDPQEPDLTKIQQVCQ
jgi:alkaline phosphatase D